MHEYQYTAFCVSDVIGTEHLHPYGISCAVLLPSSVFPFVTKQQGHVTLLVTTVELAHTTLPITYIVHLTAHILLHCPLPIRSIDFHMSASACFGNVCTVKYLHIIPIKLIT